MLYLLSELDLAGAGNAVIRVRRVAPHQDVAGSAHLGVHVGTNEHLNVTRASNRQAGAVCNQFAGVYFTPLSICSKAESAREGERCPSGTILPDAI
jgi:hypothetical protein